MKALWAGTLFSLCLFSTAQIAAASGMTETWILCESSDERFGVFTHSHSAPGGPVYVTNEFVHTLLGQTVVIPLQIGPAVSAFAADDKSIVILSSHTEKKVSGYVHVYANTATKTFNMDVSVTALPDNPVDFAQANTNGLRIIKDMTCTANGTTVEL